MLRAACLLLLVVQLLLLFRPSISSTTSDIRSDDSMETVANLENGKLVFAHVLYRHGDRTPIEPYPTDPWNKLEDWPTGWGQLTNIGKAQHLELGQWLRQRYSSLLSPTYSNSEIHVRSTDVDRTLMSAQSNLAGLYPPVQKDVWNANINWQPIPVHTIPENLDEVLAGKAPCAAYEAAHAALLASEEFTELMQRYSYLFTYLSEHTGSTVNSLELLQRINNTLYIESLYNKTLPQWTKQVFPSEDMTYLSALTFQVNTYTRTLARLKAGPLIKEILHRSLYKATHVLKPDYKLWVYSAHDTTVANVLNALKLYDVHSPPYTACILFELRVDDQENAYMSIFYKNSSAEPTALHIPNCGVACPLQKLFSLYEDILPKDWQAECKLRTLLDTYEEADLGLAMDN